MRCNFQYRVERDKELIRAYRDILSNAKYPFVLQSVLEEAVNMPCSRFWVSGEQLSKVIGRIFKGDNLEGMHQNKREMFFYLSEIVKEMRKRKEFKDAPMYHLCEIAVEQPAPKFYLTAKSAKVIIHYALKKNRCKN